MKVKPALALILVFGFSPVWLAIGGVVLGGLGSRSHLYWDVSPWFVIFAIPFCVFTIGISLATIAVHTLTPGTAERKHKFASVTFVVLCIGAASFGALTWKRQSDQKAEVKAEEERVLDFVRNHDAVRRDAVRIERVSIRAKTFSSSNWPMNYEIEVEGQSSFFAIVGVVGRPAKAEFVLRCTTTVDLRKPSNSPDRCDQPR